jgi:hypothetical protein
MNEPHDLVAPEPGDRSREPGAVVPGVVTQRPFSVGGNVPWIDCGWDFGRPPHGWKRRIARDWSAVSRELKLLRAKGVSVVRWWILAGGVNYPVGGRIEEIAERQKQLFGDYWMLRPGTLPPALGEEFLADFEALCRACSDADVKLVPSLVSFEWFGSIREFSRGRHALVFGGARGGTVNMAAVAAFLEATLQPLLEVSKRHRQAIFAWEAINEPDWAVSGGPLTSDLLYRRVSPAQMTHFIADAVQRIASAGFVATVGFKNMHAPWLLPSGWRVLERLAKQGAYLHQLHHYPNLLGERKLPAASTSPILPVCVGEFPSRQGVRGNPALDDWSDAGLDERNESTFLSKRLELIRRLGYQAAWLWATQLPSTASDDGMTRWDAVTQEQVRRFVAQLPP